MNKMKQVTYNVVSVDQRPTDEYIVNIPGHLYTGFVVDESTATGRWYIDEFNDIHIEIEYEVNCYTEYKTFLGIEYGKDLNPKTETIKEFKSSFFFGTVTTNTLIEYEIYDCTKGEK